ncbi:MAG: hypothetical protein LBJ03_01565 [Holosporales bacterium]|jgi:hypothetical protein|nr:hypothetical protein [Holosporales bacterium]
MNFKDLFKDWKSEWITRDELFKVTGGMLRATTLRTYDSQGKGIKGKESIGPKQVAYPVKEVIAYMECRAAKQSNSPLTANFCGGQDSVTNAQSNDND